MANDQTTAYVVTDGSTGRLWWAPGETIPREYRFIRNATPAEAALMRRIAEHRNPPRSLGDRLAKMITRTGVA